LIIGDDTRFGYSLSPRMGNGRIVLQARSGEAVISIGSETCVNNNSVICAIQRVEIGERCLIGDMVAIYDSDFHDTNPATRFSGQGGVKPVKVGSNVWLGSRVMVLKGITIGDNSVIGAMSLVTSDIPANCLAAGVPAKVVRAL
jgi:maltose O-acetyltransferase